MVNYVTLFPNMIAYDPLILYENLRKIVSSKEITVPNPGRQPI